MDYKRFCDLMNMYSKEIDIIFNEKQLQQFYEYMQLLIEWNEKINLTAIIEPEEIILKHFIDSLTINKYLDKQENLVDIGTGAGFPGVPIKIYRADLRIVLVDSLNKRISFLNEVIDKLQLKDVETVHIRIEEFGRNSKYREKFDNVTSRAVANLAVLSEYMLPIIKINGKCICMKGSEIKEELKESEKAINTLGGKTKNTDEFLLPKSDMKRKIVVIEKIRNTPKQYPRKPGTPSKEPIK